VNAVPFLRDARIEAEPNGIKKNIGHEWMLYSAFKQWKDFEIELVGAAFKQAMPLAPKLRWTGLRSRPNRFSKRIQVSPRSGST
jgi:hypothetical protein